MHYFGIIAIKSWRGRVYSFTGHFCTIWKRLAPTIKISTEQAREETIIVYWPSKINVCVIQHQQLAYECIYWYICEYICILEKSIKSEIVEHQISGCAYIPRSMGDMYIYIKIIKFILNYL